jgi:PDZ domain-containing protein
MSRRGLTFALAAFLLLVLGVLAAVLPVPYVVLVPGPVTDTLGSVGSGSDKQAVVAVHGAPHYSPSGHLYLTTVGVIPGNCDDEPTLLQALRAWLAEDQAVEPHQVLCPPNESADDVQQHNAQDMTQSQRAAITAALLELGKTPTSEQVIVKDVQSDVPAEKVLEPDDVVVAVNGEPVDDIDELRTLVSAKPIGTTLTVTVERDGKKHDVSVRTIDSNEPDHRPILGITPDLRATFDSPRVHIGIDPESVGGPSAGLAFTLAIIDKLTPGSLTGGRTVASTGTIDGIGTVGPIGGIQQKIYGALDADATVFLVPAGDCEDAKAVAPDSLTLVRVATLRAALDALEAIRNGSNDFPHC